MYFRTYNYSTDNLKGFPLSFFQTLYPNLIMYGNSTTIEGELQWIKFLCIGVKFEQTHSFYKYPTTLIAHWKASTKGLLRPTNMANSKWIALQSVNHMPGSARGYLQSSYNKCPWPMELPAIKIPGARVDSFLEGCYPVGHILATRGTLVTQGTHECADMETIFVTRSRGDRFRLRVLILFCPLGVEFPGTLG